ncbi:MFS transporter [Phytohabitans sp. LJ34]|uniref:MFS transporter n=1 Tax=Phytohabitans sp. LJ34 TaxID=3452217 RepID=UPI003F8BB15B
MTGGGRARRLVLVTMCAGYFLVLLDVTVVNVALPAVQAGTGAGVAGLQWVVDGYALALAALLLAAGALGDLRGHRRIVLLGLGLFGAASLACGLAPGVGVLVAARVVQGAGAALLLPGTLAIIGRAFPERGERARAIGVWAGVGSLALPAGPLVGGALVEAWGWRWVFLLNVPIVLLAAAVTARAVTAEEGRPGKRVDYAGTVLAAVALAAATFATVAGQPAVVVVAVAAAVAFVWTEARAAEPMLPLGLFRRRTFAVANLAAGLMNFGTLGLLFLLTLFLQVVQHRSALAAGAALLPLFLPLAVLAPLAGRLIARTGPRPAIVAGLAVAALGVAPLATWEAGTPYTRLFPALLAWGVGLGLLTPGVVTAAIGAAPAARSGLASGVNNTARQAGGAMGIAVYGAVAGAPGTRVFLTGLHATGLVTAALFAATAVAVWALKAG